MTPDDVLHLLARIVFGPWVRMWRDLSARARRWAKLAMLTAGVLVTTGGVAYADGSEKPAALSWIDVKDSHGISIWQYEMSLDRGGVTDPAKFCWSLLVDFSWELYRGAIAFACWLVDWTLSFDWLQSLTGPVMELGDSLQEIVDRFGATNTLLTVSAFTAVIWMARGRWALGLFELFMSLIIASLAVGVLANPVRLIAGDGGLLFDSRDTGLSVATGLANNGDTSADPEKMREETSGMLVDTFLRRPQQLVNFGRMIDDSDCEKDYQDALEAGPYGTDDDLRDAVGGCNDDAGEVAENPNSSMFMSMAVLLPAGLIVVIFAAILCLAVLVAGVYALYQSVKMIIALVLACCGARGSLWMTFAELIASLLAIAASVVFLSAYMQLIQSVFDGGGGTMQTFFVVDMLMVVGIVVYWKFRERIKASTARMAQMMAKRPGGGRATSLPGKVAFNPAHAYYKGRMALSGASSVAGGAAAVGRGYKSASGKAADGLVAGAKWAGGKADQTAGRLKFASDVAARQGAAGRVQERVGKGKAGYTGQLARVAVPLALAAATGGTSAVAHQAASQVAGAAARRASLQGKLRPRALGPGTSSSGSTPTRPRTGGPGGTSGRPSAPRIQPTASPTSPRVVPGQVVSASPTSPRPTTGPDVSASLSEDPAARLRARLAASRAIPMPGSRAIAMPTPKRSGLE